MALRWPLVAVCILAGCQSFQEPKTAIVSSNPFGIQADNKIGKANYQQADEGIATRVDAAGRKLLAANPETGLQRSLYFAAIGNAPQPEIFHVGQNMVFVTDSLVTRCQSEAELAALLALELGKIISEREAAVLPEARNSERLPPIQVSIGNATQGTDFDRVRDAELARFEKERPRNGKRLPRPDPEQLARGYLQRAGYQSGDFDAALPLMRATQNNATLERQFKGVTATGWSP
jgi:hypothetical protein